MTDRDERIIERLTEAVEQSNLLAERRLALDAKILEVATAQLAQNSRGLRILNRLEGEGLPSAPQTPKEA